MFEKGQAEDHNNAGSEPQWREVDLTRDTSKLPPKHEWIYDEDDGLLWFDEGGSDHV
jgi:hypothetical protein